MDAIEVELKPDSDRCTHFDNLSPELPPVFWETLSHMRDDCPVVKTDAHGGFWVVTRYEDVWQILQDWETFSSAQGVAVPRNRDAPLLRPIELDPPLHREWRRDLTRFMRPAVVERYETGIRDIANGLIDQFIARGHCDLAEEFAVPFPGTVFFQLFLNSDPADLPEVLKWTTVITGGGGGVSSSEATSAIENLGAYCRRLLTERQAGTPKDDLLDLLLGLEIQDQRLSVDECVLVLQLLVNAALDTTANAIGNVIVHMCEQPEIATWLRSNPERLPGALEEFLRFEATAIALGRVATRDVELRGQKIKKGDRVLVYYASANRDPREFDAPDEIQLEREKNRHLTFGAGVHRCLGMHVARLSLRVAIEQILRRLPELQLAPGASIEYSGGFGRGPENLPVRFRTDSI